MEMKLCCRNWVLLMFLLPLSPLMEFSSSLDALLLEGVPLSDGKLDFRSREREREREWMVIELDPAFISLTNFMGCDLIIVIYQLSFLFFWAKHFYFIYQNGSIQLLVLTPFQTQIWIHLRLLNLYISINFSKVIYIWKFRFIR